MNILSLKYILFIFCTYFLFWFSPGKNRKHVLLFSSFIFLFTFGFTKAILVIAYSLLVYFLSKRCKDKRDLLITIIILLTPLFFSKYGSYLAGLLNLGDSIDILSIIGISFLSFKAISYTVDEYKKKQNVSLLDYLVYMLFFPVFLSGPIERIHGFSKELEKEKEIRWDNFVSSLFRISYGMFIKMAVADRLIGLISFIYSEIEQYTLYALVAILAYSLYIYADFAGYSNIACGVSELFEIRINDNFRQPYLSFSIKEFWNRWHISLSEWLRDYIYIPLGGNRKGKMRKLINILIVFLVSGIWHGTGMGFIIWGLLNGIYQVIGDLTFRFRDGLYEKFHLKDTLIQKVIRIVSVYLLISLTWIFFAQGFNGALNVLSSLLKPRQYGVIEFALDLCSQTETSKQELIVITLSVFIMCVTDYLKRFGYEPLKRIMSANIVVRYCLLLVLMLMIIAFGKYGNGIDMENFVYFKF